MMKFSNKMVQQMYGLPILLFAMMMIGLDAAKVINVEKMGYAFFGGLIIHLLNYFFRVSPPADVPVTPVEPPKTP